MTHSEARENEMRTTDGWMDLRMVQATARIDALLAESAARHRGRAAGFGPAEVSLAGESLAGRIAAVIANGIRSRSRDQHSAGGRSLADLGHASSGVLGQLNR